MRLDESQLREFLARGMIAANDVNIPHAPGQRARPKRNEDAIQRAVCDFWELAYPETWAKTFHPPNGLAAKSRKLAAIFKGLGVKPGVFDLVCIARRGPYAGFALELKDEHGRASENQTAWAEHFFSEGWYVVIAFSLDRALKAIREYHAFPPALPGREVP